MPYVYILASRPQGTLYIGSTTDLARRMFEHRSRVVPGFTARYRVTRLVWFEPHETLEEALLRERHLKEWRRIWKIQLIEQSNPHWLDLHSELRP
jgi:putative endonuclease